MEVVRENNSQQQPQIPSLALSAIQWEIREIEKMKKKGEEVEGMLMKKGSFSYVINSPAAFCRFEKVFISHDHNSERLCVALGIESSTLFQQSISIYN